MSMRFDATLKDLVQSFLPDYEAQMGLSDFAPLTPLNVDLSTVSAATDIALGNGDPPDRIVDINFQSGPDDDLAARVLLYNALLHHRFGVPVRAFAGSGDEEASPERMSGWSAETSADFDLSVIPGGHFFDDAGERQVIATIGRDLAGLVGTSFM